MSHHLCYRCHNPVQFGDVNCYYCAAPFDWGADAGASDGAADHQVGFVDAPAAVSQHVIEELPQTRQADPSQRPMRLGDILIEDEVITDEQLRLALERQKLGDKNRLGAILISMGIVSEHEIGFALAKRFGLEFVDMDTKILDANNFGAISMDSCYKFNVAPLEDDGESLHLVFADPSDVVSLDDLRLLTKRRIVPYAGLPSAIDRALSRMKGGSDVPVAGDGGTPAAEKLVELMVRDSVRQKASDIHIEPKQNHTLVRIRVDGELFQLFKFDIESHPGLVSRIKIVSGLDISEKRRPQDGRATFQFNNKRIDARVSTLPTTFGEKVVLRLTDHSSGITGLDELGLDEALLGRLRSAIVARQGLVLITGPTGSGKTTTLYGCLQDVMDATKNILTLEDPVEKELAGATQVQIDDRIGFTFAAALRSVLRQDPDVVMVGEMRDTETAEIGMRASLTGHLVLSTIHTNDCASTLTRLIDMGIEPYLIGGALTLVVAQRLVLKLCSQCKEPDFQIPEVGVQVLGKDKAEKASWMRAEGCPACGGTGYRGRVGLYEIMPITNAIKDTLHDGVTDSEIARVARAEGVESMYEAGVRAAAAGLTSVQEVNRVLRGVATMAAKPDDTSVDAEIVEEAAATVEELVSSYEASGGLSELEAAEADTAATIHPIGEHAGYGEHGAHGEHGGFGADAGAQPGYGAGPSGGDQPPPPFIVR